MILLAILAGCADDGIVPVHFDGPVAAAMLAPELGPFTEPVGFVASSRSGNITPIDLKSGRLLTDDPTASFLRAANIPTGRDRILADVATVGTGDQVWVWAADSATRALLRIPYVESVEAGAPIEREPWVSEPTFVDADGSGDTPALAEVEVSMGWTTTEDWSIEFDGARWWARGSRSGLQTTEPRAGEPYQTDYGELSFLLTGTATAGDRFELRTDTGVEEYTLGGLVTALAARDNRVFASVASADAPAVHVYDGVTGVWLGAAWLAPGSAPGRIALGPDGGLFVGDTARPVVHRLALTFGEALTEATVTELPVAAAVVDLAWQSGETQEGAPFSHLFVAPLGLRRVDVYDLDTEGWLDPNPVTPQAWGVDLGAPVSGLTPSVGEVWLQQPTNFGARQRVPTVVVSTGLGLVHQLDAATGCVVESSRGARGPNETFDGTAWATLEDVGEGSDVDMQIEGNTGEQVVPSPCGGVTRTETWTVTYSSATLDWIVEGTESGVQQNRAREDERYLSDEGAISFALLSGPRPPTDGDRFVFATEAGLLAWNGSDLNGDGAADEAWDAPARPVAFATYAGATGGGWDAVDLRQYVLLPVTNTDITSILWLDTGQEYTPVE